jgi:N,N'-diacetyllegionaminate synthase
MIIRGIDTAERVMVIAEIGNNHEGNYRVAETLVHKAAECGVDAVKFQTFKTKYFVSNGDKARYDRLRSFELPYESFERLQVLASSLGLLFISTPLDIASAEFLASLVDCFKIASGDNNFYPLIARVCQTSKPLIVSSGASDLAQITRTKAFIEEQWQSQRVRPELGILHCISSYPAPADEVNLAAIPFLLSELKCTIGYSDHTIGIAACLGAVILGAQIIEKHFTLDKQYSDFRDHQLSADPPEMKRLVEEIRQTRRMRGSGAKVLQPCEANIVNLLRRSIVAGKDLPAGHLIGMEDLTWIRPATGLPPGSEAQICGSALRRPIKFGEPILPQDLE